MSKKFIGVLKFIIHKLEGKKINWALTGSSALALRGIKIEPRDIDIVTNKQGAYKINQLLKKYEIEPVKFSKTDRLSSHFGKFKIKEVPVEVIGNFSQKLDNGSWTEPTSLKNKKIKEIIKFDNSGIPALSFDYEYKFYIRNSKNPKRIEETKKIREYIDKNSKNKKGIHSHVSQKEFKKESKF